MVAGSAGSKAVTACADRGICCDCYNGSRPNYVPESKRETPELKSADRELTFLGSCKKLNFDHCTGDLSLGLTERPRSCRDFHSDWAAETH